MPHVGVNNEPLLDRLVFGFDGTNYRAIKVDTDGNLVAAVKADQAIQARGYGWIGGAWQKNPLQLGYSGQVFARKSNLNALAGYNQLTSDAVPAGEIWVINAIGAFNSISAVTQLTIYLAGTGVSIYLASLGATAANQPVLWSGSVVLKEGDTIASEFYGCTLNDDLYLDYIGVRVDIDQ